MAGGHVNRSWTAGGEEKNLGARTVGTVCHGGESGQTCMQRPPREELRADTNQLGTMGIRTFVLAAATFMLLASASSAQDATPANKGTRGVVTAENRPTVTKKLREAKRLHRVAVIPTDVRQKRYLAFGDELDTQTGAVQTRRLLGGDAISDGP
jgi:hypothetical protein